jgi:hypothetical protein
MALKWQFNDIMQRCLIYSVVGQNLCKAESELTRTGTDGVDADAVSDLLVAQSPGEERFSPCELAGCEAGLIAVCGGWQLVVQRGFAWHSVLLAGGLNLVRDVDFCSPWRHYVSSNFGIICVWESLHLPDSNCESLPVPALTTFFAGLHDCRIYDAEIQKF